MRKIRAKEVQFFQTTLNSLQVCVIILGVGLVVWIAWRVGNSFAIGTWPPTVEKLSSWSQVIIAYAAIFAIGQYAVSQTETADRKTKTVLGSVKFFREYVIDSSEKIAVRVKKSPQGKLPFILLRKKTPHLKFTEEEFFGKISPNQDSELQTYIEMSEKDLGLGEMVRSCLNCAEEFSIGIINSQSQNHIATSSIRKPFVQIIESLAIPLYFHIGVLDDEFPYISELYRHWKKQVGFIPQLLEDKMDIYKDRKNKYKRGQN